MLYEIWFYSLLQFLEYNHSCCTFYPSKHLQEPLSKGNLVIYSHLSRQPFMKKKNMSNIRRSACLNILKPVPSGMNVTITATNKP